MPRVPLLQKVKEITSEAPSKEESVIEHALRPESLETFIGQPDLCTQLGILLKAAHSRREPLGHCLLSGPPGLGKTSLAHILARAMGTQLVVTSGPVIEKPGDLAGLLTNLQHGDVLFIDEIHRLSRVVEEYLYPAMEDFVLDLMIDSGPNARSVQVRLKHFTLIGATTRAGLLSSPLRSRFGFAARFNYYAAEDLMQIVLRSARLLQQPLEEAAALAIAARSRGTPRIANRLFRWVRDYTHAREEKTITLSLALEALKLLAIDDNGLDEMDRRILQMLIENYSGGPVGLKTLAVAVGEEADSVEELHEPFLVLQGYLQRTPRGRVATDKAWQLFGRSR